MGKEHKPLIAAFILCFLLPCMLLLVGTVVSVKVILQLIEKPDLMSLFILAVVCLGCIGCWGAVQLLRLIIGAKTWLPRPRLLLAYLVCGYLSLGAFCILVLSSSFLWTLLLSPPLWIVAYMMYLKREYFREALRCRT